MLRRHIFHCLLGGMLCSAGSLQAVIWERKYFTAAASREERVPEETAAAVPVENDLTPDPYLVKAPPIPKATALPRPAPKPQPTPRPTAPPPGAVPTPGGSKPTPTPPVTRPS